MSFSKTVSVFAALASIFAAGATGWKLADSQKEVPLSPLDQKVMELEKKLDQAQQPQVAPEPVKLPAPTVQTAPQPATLPPVTPPPPVTENVTP
jgi:hypothetical protein